MGSLLRIIDLGNLGMQRSRLPWPATAPRQLRRQVASGARRPAFGGGEKAGGERGEGAGGTLVTVSVA